MFITVTIAITITVTITITTTITITITITVCGIIIINVVIVITKPTPKTGSRFRTESAGQFPPEKVADPCRAREATANLRTKILDSRGSDSSRILI